MRITAKIEQVKKDLAAIQKNIEELERERNTHLVPDNIQFADYGYGLKLWFGDKQCLQFDNGDYFVAGRASSSSLVKTELVECEKEDLKPGDFFFFTDESGVASSNLLGQYGMWIGCGRYLRIVRVDRIFYPRPTSYERRHYYKVRRLK